MANGNLLKQGFSNFNKKPGFDDDPTNKGLTTPVEQSFIEGVMGLGWSLIGSGLSKQFDNPALMKSAEDAGKGVVKALKQDWYQTQAENFMNTHGKQYEDQLKMAQKRHKLATSAQRMVNPETGEEVMGYLEYDVDGTPTGAQILSTDYEAVTAHLLKEKQRFFEEAHNLSSGFMNSAGKYAGNPIIAKLVENNIGFWQQHAEGMSKARGEARDEAKFAEDQNRRAQEDAQKLERAGSLVAVLANKNNKDPFLKEARQFIEDQGLLDDPDTGKVISWDKVMQDPIQARRIMDAFDTFADMKQRAAASEKQQADIRRSDAQAGLYRAQALDARTRAKVRDEEADWGSWDSDYPIVNLRTLVTNSEGFGTLVNKKRVEKSDQFSKELSKLESEGKNGLKSIHPTLRPVFEQYLREVQVSDAPLELRQSYADYLAEQYVRPDNPKLVKEGAVLWMLESKKARKQLRDLHDEHPEWGEYKGSRDTREFVEWIYDKMYPEPSKLFTPPPTAAREVAPQGPSPSTADNRAELPASERGRSLTRDLEAMQEQYTQGNRPEDMAARGWKDTKRILGRIKYPNSSAIGAAQKK